MSNQCPIHRPPTAKGWPFLGSLPSIYLGVIDAFRRMRATYGDVVRFRLPFESGYLVSCPHLIQQTLIQNEFTKGDYYKKLETAFGEGLLTATDDKWRRQRKLLQPFFQLEKIKDWQPIVNQYTSEMLGRWDDLAAQESEVDAIVEMRQLLQRIMSQMMFGSEIQSDLALRAAKAISTVNENIFSELIRTTLLRGPLKNIRTPGLKRYQQAVEEFDDIINQCLEKEDVSEGNHMLAHFRRARYADTGEPMDDKQFRDEVATFFFAGQETTANALGWAFYLLSQNPHVVDKVADEVESHGIATDSNYDDFVSLTCVENVINEVLRLYPPAYGIERHVNRQTELGGYELQDNSLIVVAPGVVHVHPDYWDDPTSFRPERFNEAESKTRPQFAYFPFGGGARKCIGMQLAMMEMKTIIALVCSRFSFDLKPGAGVKARVGLTQQPYPTIPIRLSKQPTA